MDVNKIKINFKWLYSRTRLFYNRMRDWIGLIQFPMIALMFIKTYDLGYLSLIVMVLSLFLLTLIDIKWLIRWELGYTSMKNPVFEEILYEVRKINHSKK